MNQGWKKDYFRYKDYFLNVLTLYRSKPNLKIYLELILSLSTIIIFSTFAIRPTVLTILELNNEINSKEQTVLLLKQKVNDLQTANSIIQSRSDDLQYISEAVPESANQDILIKQIELIADNNSVQIVGLTAFDINLIGDDKKKKDAKETKVLAEGSKEISFTVSVTGEYNNIFSFLTTIETMRRPVKIESLTMNTTTTNNGNMIALTLTGRVPFIKN